MANIYISFTYILFYIVGCKVVYIDGDQQCECGCPDGWTAYNGSCYMFGHGTGMPFVEAEHYCQQHHGEIVNINSADENLFLKDYVSKLGGARYYIGLTDEAVEGIWRWYDNNDRATLFDWCTNEPNGEVDRGNEDCVVLLAGSCKYRWADVPCSEHNQPVCEIRKASGVSAIIG